MHRKTIIANIMIKGFNVQVDDMSHYSTVSFVYHLIFMKANTG